MRPLSKDVVAQGIGLPLYEKRNLLKALVHHSSDTDQARLLRVVNNLPYDYVDKSKSHHAKCQAFSGIGELPGGGSYETVRVVRLSVVANASMIRVFSEASDVQ